MTKVYESPTALLGAEGTELGATDWITVSQEQIDTFG
jgi:hypothetical protein